MDSPASPNDPNNSKKGLGCLQVIGLVVLTMVVSVAVTVWVINIYLFPQKFEPVELSASEQQTLTKKFEVFEGFPGSRSGSSAETTGAQAGSDQSNNDQTGGLEPLPYTEKGADRTLALTERELNAILAKNTDLADKVAIDLSNDLVSARLRIPMDPDFPFFGGKTLKARAGMEIKFDQLKPVAVLKGISVMGVPIPNAWMGGMKDVDLVSHFGQSEGFWKSLAEGIDHVQVVEGALQLKLRE